MYPCADAEALAFAQSEPAGTRTAALVRDAAASAEGAIIEWRRLFHKHPEVSGQESHTQEMLCDELDRLGVEYRRLDNNGIIATIRGEASGSYDAAGVPVRRVALRADIDALPVTEDTGVPFASENEGVMHACGHDAHMAMMLGAIRILLETKSQLKGEVRILFQPAEEISIGALSMIDAGALDGVDAIYGAHGSMPHKGVDAVVVGAEMVNGLQVLVSRDVSPFDPVVVTVGEFHGGEARNVMAGHAYLSGTVRTWTEKLRREVPDRLERIVSKIGHAFGAKVKFTFEEGNAGLSNDSVCAEVARRAVVDMLGESAVSDYRGTLSGEDFSEYLNIVPGVFCFVGTRNPEVGASHPQHSSHFTIDESVLAKGSMVAAQWACRMLAAE